MKETEATNLLEKKFKANPSYGQKEAVELAISSLQVRRGLTTGAEGLRARGAGVRGRTAARCTARMCSATHLAAPPTPARPPSTARAG